MQGALEQVLRLCSSADDGEDGIVEMDEELFGQLLERGYEMSADGAWV